MNTRDATTSEAFVSELEALAAEFAAARRAKPYARAPFPLKLLERACELDVAAPRLGVLRRLHLDPEKVRARVRIGADAARAAAKVAGEAERLEKAARAPKAESTKRARQATTRFVAIPLGAAPAARVVSVIVDWGNGVRVTIEISPERSGSVANFVTSLVGGAA